MRWVCACSCGGLLRRAESVVCVGYLAMDLTRLLGSQHPLPMHLKQSFWRGGARRGRIESPAEMLARMPAPDGDAVMGKHLLVERGQQGMLRRQRRRAGGAAGNK